MDNHCQKCELPCLIIKYVGLCRDCYTKLSPAKAERVKADAETRWRKRHGVGL